jgi:hypothetical protein
MTEPATFFNVPGLTLSVESVIDVWQANSITLAAQPRSDAYGQWKPLTIRPGADILSNQPEPSADQPDDGTSWNYEAVNRAWVALADFLVNEWVDSELAWDDSEQNRRLVADRVTASGWWAPTQADGPTFLDLLGENSPYLLGQVLGPWAVDQDWHSWRQDGLTQEASIFPAQGDEASLAQARQAEERYRSRLRPAQPAPYQLDQPRSLVTSLVLSSIRGGESSEMMDLTVHLSYVRPIVMDGVAGSRYEFTDVYLIASLATSAEGELSLTALSQSGLSRTDIALFPQAEISSLPRLPRSGATAEAGSAVELLDLSFVPPAQARPDETTCQIDPPEDWSGRFAGFALPEVDGLPACLGVWAYPIDQDSADGALGDIPIYLTQTVWGYQSGAVQGRILIDSYPSSDTVMVELLGETNRYRVEATLAPGAGTDFIDRLMASFRFA